MCLFRSLLGTYIRHDMQTMENHTMMLCNHSRKSRTLYSESSRGTSTNLCSDDTALSNGPQGTLQNGILYKYRRTCVQPQRISPTKWHNPATTTVYAMYASYAQPKGTSLERYPGSTTCTHTLVMYALPCKYPCMSNNEYMWDTLFQQVRLSSKCIIPVSVLFQ
mgnify:CR=1 FL=1